MTLHLETDVIASGFDAPSQTFWYTVSRGGKRYTARVLMVDLLKVTDKMAKRTLVANALMKAVQGEPDAI